MRFATSILSLLHLSASFQVAPHRRIERPHRSLPAERTTAVQEEEDEATLRSITFCNLPKDQEPDLLCDFLLELGACSASVVDADRGTDSEEPLFGDPWRQQEDSLHWAGTTAAIWNRCNVTAHFPASINIEATLALLRDNNWELPSSYTVEQVPNRDWLIHVQQGWTPIVVADRFVLRFPWHTDVDVGAATMTKNGSLIELKLQGGIAFGTGEHPTTQLCLEWLHTVVSMLLLKQEQDVTILDYGAGSGILGMGACAMGHRVSAVGIDIDVDACRIANANAEANDLPMRSYLPPLIETDDDESKSLLLKAHAYASAQNVTEDLILPNANDIQYNICVANILAAPLVALAPTLLRMIRPGGYLGMSGILSQQGKTVVEAYQKAGFENVEIAKEMGGWILVTGRRERF